MKFLNIGLDFFNRYYDKILLGTVLLVLTFVLLVQTKSLSETRIRVKDAEKDWNKSSKIIEPIEASKFEARVDVDRHISWDKSYGEGSLFDPGEYVYSVDGSPYLLHMSTITNPYTGRPDVEKSVSATAVNTDSAQGGIDSDGDGIPDTVEDKSGLNKRDGGDAVLDKDHDGFTNLEEFSYETEVNDPTSRPRLIRKVRFFRKYRNPLEVMLKKVNTNNDFENKKNWDIMIKYKSQSRWKTDFLKIGDVIPEYGYRIIDAEYREVIKENIPTERSQISLEKNGQDPIVLVRNRPAFTGDEYYELLYLLKSKPLKITLQADKQFKLRDLHGKTEIYKLVSSDSGQLTCESVDTGDSFEIIKYSPSDKK